MPRVPPCETLPYEVQERSLQEAIGIAGMWGREKDELNFRVPRQFAEVSRVEWTRRAEHIAPNAKYLAPDARQIAAEVDRELILFEPDA